MVLERRGFGSGFSGSEESNDRIGGRERDRRRRKGGEGEGSAQDPACQLGGRTNYHMYNQNQAPI